MYARVSIIILNWNGWKDTIECLESLYQIDYPNYDVIVVDNDSEDKSPKKIKEYCFGKLKIESKFFEYSNDNKPINVIEYFKNELEYAENSKNIFKNLNSNKKLILIKNNKNYGFAEGNNIAIRYVQKCLNSKYILLLNNDTVVDKEFLNELVMAAECYPNVGFVGPKTYYYNYNGRNDVINFAGGKLDLLKGSVKHIGINEIDKGQYNQTKIVDYVEGSCLLIKKEILKEVGLIDNRYFAYWEENDLCMRGLNENYCSLYVSKAKIWHKVSSSSKEVIKIYYLTRNRFWFIKKYSDTTQFTIFILYFFLFEFWFNCFIYFIYGRKVFVSFIKGVRNGII